MHPRIGLAVRTGIAAGLAWLVAEALPEQAAGRYAYFAPLGAVIVTSTTVLGTARELGRSVLALAIGAALGLAAVSVLTPNVFSVAVVVAVGVLIAGWRRLSSASTWVPTVALFTMILGRNQPVTYVSAYTGLTALGAAVGAGVVVLVPQLMLTPMEDAVHRARLTITGQLRRLRDDLCSLEVIGVIGEDELETARMRLRDNLRTGHEGARLNAFSRRYRVGDRRRRAEAVERCTARMIDLVSAIKDLQADDRLPRRGEINAALAEALDLILSALRDGHCEPLGDRFDRALSALDPFVQELAPSDPGRHVIGRTVDTVRRLGRAAEEAVDLSLRTDGGPDPKGGRDRS